jgi:hypothetical protein
MREKANASSWQRTPFQPGVPIRCSLSFSDDEFQRLQSGLIPAAMEDKWFIYYDEPFLFFHRSWTGEPVYRVRFAVRGERACVDEALLSANLRAEDGHHDTLLLDFLISNLLLGKDKPFPVPAGAADVAGVYQHHVAGTAYPEENVPAGNHFLEKVRRFVARISRRTAR